MNQMVIAREFTNLNLSMGLSYFISNTEKIDVNFCYLTAAVSYEDDFSVTSGDCMGLAK